MIIYNCILFKTPVMKLTQLLLLLVLLLANAYKKENVALNETRQIL